ncbi:MAG: biopolymer transporter ExbD [Bacteroidales bacterium]|nr:biopolymer transporter ExbD [Bacteroidales bacterium]MBR6310640.1 biopolymer transporter ExbD [Paludibacteraceae bacterium]MDD6357300.1 biopolymer transporter ExbD [Bacteroidales bacterium]
MGKRKVPEINSSSMADISFLLLIFFLVTTSMSVDKGLARRLPPPVTNTEDMKIDVKERNVLVVLLNTNNQLMVGGKYTDVKDLKETAKEFIKNPNNAENLPEKRDTVLPNLGAMKYTKNHVISLQNDRGTEYQAYLKVQNELDAAYNELRDELSKERFGTTFAELDEERQEEVKVIYDKKVSEAEPKNYGGK